MPSGNFDTLSVTGAATVRDLSVGNVLEAGGKFETASSGNGCVAFTIQAESIQFAGPGHPPRQSPQSLGLQTDGGNVGIGTLDPKAKLDIRTDDRGRGDVLVAGRLESISRHGGGLFVDSGDHNALTERFIGSDSKTGIGFFNGGWRLVVQRNGNVGIGTTEPKTKLHISSPDDYGTVSIDAPADKEAGIILQTAGLDKWEIYRDQSGDLRIWESSSQKDRVTIKPGGNIGIGTLDPKAKLDVSGGDIQWGNHSSLGSDQGGSIELGGDRSTPGNGTPYIDFHFRGLTQDFNTRIINDADGTLSIVANILNVSHDLRVAGDIYLVGADCAEEFSVDNARSTEPGTVMVINNEGVLQPSQEPYDKRAAGVISGAGDFRPGMTLDKQDGKSDRLPLALSGKVYCKVDAQYGPIEVGDLLTTSPTPGHAMKATDSSKAFGTVIGKALRSLSGGRGLIPVLVALQ